MNSLLLKLIKTFINVYFAMIVFWIVIMVETIRYVKAYPEFQVLYLLIECFAYCVIYKFWMDSWK